ncbi:MAG: PIG-L family deacetylase [Holosporaceae bacterium]|jgi:LmbE family N-acetylglucosaminyl deacetylase|nr:PIG-L family deacetylase [Holosporaceae bacterium]
MNVIVIAPHPDDETLGCGGTILKHKEAGDSVYCVFVTSMWEEYGFSEDQIKIQEQQINNVSRVYNFDDIFQLKYPTTRLDIIPMAEIIFEISGVFKQVMPEVVYLPNRSDVHSDHRVVFYAAFACTKAFRCPSIKKILMYETISETNLMPAFADNMFIPNYYINITKYFERKVTILETCYDKEIGLPPFPRSIQNVETLAKFRAMGGGGMQYAEAFCLIKRIV